METNEKNGQKLLSIFNNIFKTAFTDLNINRADLEQWDSMRHVELIIKIQNEFKVTLNIQDVLEIKSLNDFLLLV